MPSKFGANLGPNSGAAASDGSAKTFDTFDASNSPANVPQPTSAANSPDLVEQTNSANAGPAPVSTPQNPFSRDQVISSSPDDHPVYTKASGSGDIVLKPEKQTGGFSKKPLVISAIIIGIVALILIIVLTIVGKKNNIGQIRTAWLEYEKILIEGDDEEGIDLQGQWYIEHLLQEGSEDDTDINGYSNSLSERYNNFLKNFEDSKLRNDNELSQSIEMYTEVFAATKLLLDIPQITTNYEETFTAGGQEAADNYLQSALPSNTENYSGTPKTIVDSTRQYFDYERQIYNLYQENNCIVDGILDTECVTRIEGEALDSQLSQLYNELEGLRNFISSYSDILISSLINLTTKNTESLGAGSEQ